MTQVQRTFVDLPQDGQIDIEQAAYLAAISSTDALTWEQLLQSDRVLIVSESGGGKSYECQQQCQRLWDSGESAFFLELAVLAVEPLKEQLSAAQRERYARWQADKNERATFFLDSVDELKLTQRSFEFTLKRLSTTLWQHLARARIVLTSRPISIDREQVRKWLPVPPAVEDADLDERFASAAMGIGPPIPGKAEATTALRCVALCPLSQEQMRGMAQQLGVADVEVLLDAIDAQNADEFAKRPLDFIELCGDWRSHGRIRSHSEQIRHDVEIKLRPRADRAEHGALAPQRAREGAERIALATLLTRRLTVWHSHDADRGKSDSALDPSQVLLDWSDVEVKTLLERPLFGFATYGRVRFHHRSVTEFLASQRLEELLRRGMPAKTLHRLLYNTTPVAHDVVKPIMQPVAAWLAATNTSVRAEVLRRDPSILLRMADPGSLDQSTREAALSRYVDVYGLGGARGLVVPALQIRRFSSVELAQVVERLWQRGLENPEVRRTLLQMIDAGAMKECAGIAYSVAVDPSLSIRERAYALRALAALGDARLSLLVDEMGTNATAWPDELARNAIIRFFPAHMSALQLIRILESLQPESDEIGGHSEALSKTISNGELSSADRMLLLSRLVDLIGASLNWHLPRHAIVAARWDLIPTLVVLCRLELRSGQVNPVLFAAIALTMCISGGGDRDSGDSDSLRAMLSTASSTIRASVFWAIDRLMRRWEPSVRPDAQHRLFLITDHVGFELNWQRDAAWISHAIAESNSLDERSILLESFLLIAQGRGDALVVLKALRPIIAGAPTLVATLEKAISDIETPAPEPEMVQRHRLRAEEIRNKQTDQREHWKLVRREIMADIDGSFSPERREQTAWTLWRAMHHSNRERGRWDRNAIEHAFNKTIADRLRAELMRAWREGHPTLRLERHPESRVSDLQKWTMGLSGLYAEAEDPMWASSLGDSEAELAVRYALLQLNSLPPWMEALSGSHPSVVAAILGDELQRELDDVSETHSIMLQNITHSSPSVFRLFVSRISAWLKGQLAEGRRKDLSNRAIRCAIHFLADHGTRDDFEYLRATVLSRIQGSPTQIELVAWLPFLLRLDGLALVREVERLAAAVTPGPSSPVTEWLGELFGQRGYREESGVEKIRSAPTLLLRMSRLACAHVRYEDDVRRSGIFAPDARDQAEHAREALIRALLETRGVEGWQLKMDFCRDSASAEFRDRAEFYANEKLSEDFDETLFDERGVVGLERNFEFAPTNRADMAALLCARLSDLDDLLLQDASPRELWSKATEERLLRRAIAQSLQDSSRSAYFVHQEGVTGDEKETDIRLVSSAGRPLEAAIELKLAETEYTIREYESALRDQLVRKYLAPEHRRVGCLMIAISKQRTWRHPDDQREMSFEDVIVHLSKKAKDLEAELDFEVSLMIKGLDLRPRVQSRKTM